MINVSSDFKTAMKQSVKEIQAYINCGSTQIKSEDDLISFKISVDTGLCKTAMRKIEGKVIGDHNLLGQWIQPSFGVKKADKSYEFLNYGSFLVTEITYTKDTGITSFTGYDKMVNSMVPYTALDVEYPMRLIDYTRVLCEACGLELGNEIFGDNYLSLNKNILWREDNTITKIITDDNNITITYTGDSATYKRLWQENNLQIPNGHYDFSGIATCTDENTTVGIGIDVYPKDSTTRSTWYEFWLSPTERANGTRKHRNDVFIDNDNYYYRIRFFLSQTVGTTENTVNFKDIMLKDVSNNVEYSLYNTMNDWQITQDLWQNIDGITYRDILVQIAQATGTTAIISDDKIYFKPLSNTGEQLTYDNMFKWKLEPLYGEINSVVLSRTPQEDNIYMRDEDSINANGLTEWKIENNEIIDKDRDNAMTPIYNAMHGINYYPFEITTEGLGWYEVADNFDIQNDLGDVFNTSLFNYSITVDGGIKETLKTVAETKTQTQYQYATTIAKRVKNTEIIVNKQEEYINSLVSDMYDEDGLLNENFTQVYQNITNIVNSVQNSGGSNLIKNSVMFEYDNEGNPSNWNISGSGTLEIQTSSEAINQGGLSGHVFILNNKYARQEVKVKAYDGTDPTYYSFSCRIKKNATGSCYVRLYNTTDDYIIEVPVGEEVYYKEYTLQALLPSDNYYIVEFYGSADSDATFTDCMLAQGEYKTQWQQANGEIMNTQVNISVDGVVVKSSVYAGDYTIMSPLEFAGYSFVNGVITRVFSLNKDTTEVEKLKVKKEMSMYPIKIVPVTDGNIKGWAFVPVDEEV